MAHYAKVVKGIVEKVIVAEPEYFDTLVDDSPGRYIQTSYNTKGGKHYEADGVTLSADQSKALRKNYCGPGWVYDDVRDAFYTQQPFPSWTLNETTCYWEPPIPRPTDREYKWSEENYQAALADSSDLSVAWI